MESIYDQIFENIDYSEAGIPKGEYESCTFKNCIFINANFSHRSFMDCTFENCDWTGVKLGDTGLKEVKFFECKLVGVDFSPCNPFLLAVDFEHCVMNLASFYRLSLKGTRFQNCNLEEADFVETDLTNAKFIDSSLVLAQFDQSNLTKADLRTAVHYIIDPTKNRIAKAQFSKDGLVGLLNAFDIIVEE